MERLLLEHMFYGKAPDLELAQQLMDQGVDLNAGTALGLAAGGASFTAAKERRDAGMSQPDIKPGYWQESAPYPWYERGVKLQAKDNELNVLVRLVTRGDDDPTRLEFLIKNGIDLQKFGANALLLAVRNEKRCLSNCLLDHGVRVTPSSIRMVLWKRVKSEITGYIGYFDDEEVDDCILDDQALDEAISGNRIWKEIYERVQSIEKQDVRTQTAILEKQ